MFQIPIVAEHFFKILKKGIFNNIANVSISKDKDADREKDIYLKAFSFKRSASGINWYRGALRYSIFELIGKKPMFASTRKIWCHTKVIWGTGDLALDVNLVRSFKKVVLPNKLSITLLPGISHWAPQEAPHDVLTQILAFMQIRKI
jgi:pimeloyl-ACP methyl ester carboxylesterase